MSQDNNKKKFLKLGVTFIGTAIFTLVSIMAIMYARQRFDSNIPEAGTSQDSEIVKKNDGHTASMRYSGHITIKPDEELIDLYFENPIRSRKSILLKIVGDINGKNITLAETEKILPGEKITSIKYKADKNIEKGQYLGKFELYFYNEEGQEEIVNSSMNINITVE